MINYSQQQTINEYIDYVIKVNKNFVYSRNSNKIFLSMYELREMI